MIDFMLFWGFADRQTDRPTNERTNERTDIGGCRVAYATEKLSLRKIFIQRCLRTETRGILGRRIE